MKKLLVCFILSILPVLAQIGTFPPAGGGGESGGSGCSGTTLDGGLCSEKGIAPTGTLTDRFVIYQSESDDLLHAVVDGVDTLLCIPGSAGCGSSTNTYRYPIQFYSTGSQNGSSARQMAGGPVIATVLGGGTDAFLYENAGTRFTFPVTANDYSVFILPPLTYRTGGITVDLVGFVGPSNGNTDPAQFTLDRKCIIPGTTTLASPVTFSNATNSNLTTWDRYIPNTASFTVVSEDLCATTEITVFRLTRFDGTGTEDDNLLVSSVTFWITETN